MDEKFSAEIPSTEDPVLRELVLKNLIHNPCGAHDEGAVCMRDGKCTKKFPKQFVRETGHEEDHYYMTYRRRSPADGGVSTP